MNFSLTRRQYLRGIGGIALGLPLLPSLLRRPAYGADPLITAPRRFIAITTEHGGITRANMYPAAAPAPAETSTSAGHTVRRDPLTLQIQGDRAALSPVISGPAATFTPSIASKANVLQGLDIPFYINHHGGGHLGNFARNNSEDSVGSLEAVYVPTIDQVMGWSSSFYTDTDLTGIKARVAFAGMGDRLSWNYSNPGARSGVVQAMPNVVDPVELFDSLIGERSPGPAPMPRDNPVVDLVLEDYKRLRESNRRLSAADRQRLDDHMDRLAELERRLKVVPRDCGSVVSPGEGLVPERENDPSAAALYHAALNDVVVAALACDTTRVVAIRVIHNFSDFSGDWHQDIAHRHEEPAAQETLAAALQKAFEHVVLDLVSKLDVEEVPGATYLDSSLVAWSQESGVYTHDADSIPIVTFGSAGGQLKTGSYCDYRNRSESAFISDSRNDTERYAGIPYSRWLASALLAMGVPASEWDDGNPGYGTPYGLTQAFPGQDDHFQAWSPRFSPTNLAALSSMLPFL